MQIASGSGIEAVHSMDRDWPMPERPTAIEELPNLHRSTQCPLLSGPAFDWPSHDQVPRNNMPFYVPVKIWRFACFLPALALAHSTVAQDLASPPAPGLPAVTGVRMTPLVKAIAQARPSVVNIRGSKTVIDDAPAAMGQSQQTKQVNGMGTGVVIDSRGFILTNYHVVEDVTQIRVSTSARETVIGELLAHDRQTDLALLRINTQEALPEIHLGSSSDVMLAESVAAIGNAYGYEHTVTVGIVSELGRTVQVSDDQIYYDLIQTDASINPGNSGGPLLNLDGQMIGINVAVRVGAQGIAFAIPTNEGIEVAADLLKQVVSRSVNLGLSVATQYHASKQPTVNVVGVEPNSAAADAGIQVGDQLLRVGDLECVRALDVYRALIDRPVNAQVPLQYRRGDRQEVASLQLTPGRASPVRLASTNAARELAWSLLGIEVAELPRDSMRRINANYESGLRIVQIRPNSPAEHENLRVGDVIVAMAEWKTESIENLNYILQQPEIQSRNQFKFYIFRNNEPLYGQIRVANVPR